MKLASLKHGRDGKLIVVSKDLSRAASAEKIAPTLQNALDSWKDMQPKLAELARAVEDGQAATFPFDPAQCVSPLPRAYQWADASIYESHVERVRKSRGAEMPPDFHTNPLMYQGGSDAFLGPRDNILMEREDWGIDFEAETAIITGDVPMGMQAAETEKHILLLMLVNDVSLRYIAAAELQKGFGFFQAKPSSAFSPVAVTPDELGTAWKDGKVHLPMLSMLNGASFGHPDAGTGMAFSYPQLIAHAAKTRPLCAGTIIGSGTVSNKDLSKGFSCIVEKRIVEKLESGESKTPFLKFGDSVRIEMNGTDGKSVFGAIEQKVKAFTPPSA